jgi:tungstate transport system ATP-binding protein
MDMPLIELKKLCVYSDNSNGSAIPLVHDIDLDIYPEKIIGIVGPSGAGKTTLLKALALLLQPNRISGRYIYKGTQILPLSNGNNIQDIRKDLIFIHQFPVLFKGTVEYNIRYGLKLRNKSNETEYLNQLIASFKLDELLDRNVSSLSGGEKQRVCLSRAMALKPRVLILDEPTQNLDPANIKNIEKNLKRFRDIDNGTVIIVTHNLFQARRITDRTAILINGRIVETNETKMLFKSPEKQETTDFLSGKIIF